MALILWWFPILHVEPQAHIVNEVVCIGWFDICAAGRLVPNIFVSSLYIQPTPQIATRKKQADEKRDKAKQFHTCKSARDGIVSSALPGM